MAFLLVILLLFQITVSDAISQATLLWGLGFQRHKPILPPVVPLSLHKVVVSEADVSILLAG
jgi:hypothetical protein